MNKSQYLVNYFIFHIFLFDVQQKQNILNHLQEASICQIAKLIKMCRVKLMIPKGLYKLE